MEGAQFFRYRQGNSILHKMHPALKIVLMFAFAVAAFYVPLIPAFTLWGVLILSSILFLHFSVSEVISDLRPVIFYGFFLYVSSVIVNYVSLGAGSLCAAVPDAMPDWVLIFIPSDYYIALFIHLALSLEVSSVFYRTTSSVQFKNGFESIERFVTKKDDCPVSESLSLTITFIPRIASFWSKLNTAWISRGGRNSIRKIFHLVPALFSLSMKEGYRKAQAIQMRK